MAIVLPSEWNLCVIVPIFKKANQLLCKYFRDTALVNTAYKVLTTIRSIEMLCSHVAMSEFDIPSHLITLIKTILFNVDCRVRIQNDLTCTTKRGLGQGNSVSCGFFNLALEKVIRFAEVDRRGAIMNKSIQILAYAVIMIQ